MSDLKSDHDQLLDLLGKTEVEREQLQVTTTRVSSELVLLGGGL
jgi:hypothetical protein